MPPAAVHTTLVGSAMKLVELAVISDHHMYKDRKERTQPLLSMFTARMCMCICAQRTTPSIYFH